MENEQVNDVEQHVKGVYYHQGKWEAVIHINKKKYIERFEKKEEAVAQRNAWEKAKKLMQTL
jgi:hypothetical protein